MSFEVKIIAPGDIVWAVEVAGIRMLEEEVGRPDFVNRKALYDLTDRIIDEETAYVCWKGEERVGVLGWLLVPNLYNPDLTIASEILWYVLSDHKGSRAGYLLLKAFSEYIDKTGFTATMSLLDTSKVNEKSLERFGFFKKEQQFLKN